MKNSQIFAGRATGVSLSDSISILSELTLFCKSDIINTVISASHYLPSTPESHTQDLDWNLPRRTATVPSDDLLDTNSQFTVFPTIPGSAQNFSHDTALIQQQPSVHLPLYTSELGSFQDTSFSFGASANQDTNQSSDYYDLFDPRFLVQSIAPSMPVEENGICVSGLPSAIANDTRSFSGQSADASGSIDLEWPGDPR